MTGMMNGFLSKDKETKCNLFEKKTNADRIQSNDFNDTKRRKEKKRKWFSFRDLNLRFISMIFRSFQ